MTVYCPSCKAPIAHYVPAGKLKSYTCKTCGVDITLAVENKKTNEK